MKSILMRITVKKYSTNIVVCRCLRLEKARMVFDSRVCNW